MFDAGIDVVILGFTAAHDGKTVEAIAGALSDIELSGALWALVAAVGFAFLQASNRKANLLLDAYRTAFGLLVAVEVVLLVRSLAFGDIALLFSAPPLAVLIFGVTTTVPLRGGWTLLALSQQSIGLARTGALISFAPIIGTLVAALALDEPLTVAIAGGVLLAVVGVAMISLSGGVPGSDEWRRPWLALTVAMIWGSTPLLIRLGLGEIRSPCRGAHHRTGLERGGLCLASHRHRALAGTGAGQGDSLDAVRWSLRGDCGVRTMAVVRSHHHRHSHHHSTAVGALRHRSGADHVSATVRAHEPAVLRRSGPGAHGRHHRPVVLRSVRNPSPWQVAMSKTMQPKWS